MIVTVTPNPVLDRTLTVPTIILNEMLRAQEIREDWGGKGINVSRALHALGLPSITTGFIGGNTGKKLVQGLHSLGIKTDVVYIQGETRTNIIITDAKGEQYIKVNEPGPKVMESEVQRLFALAKSYAQDGDIWALCGSLPPGIPADFYAQLIALLQSRGVKVVLDTSGEPLRLGLSARPYMIKPNINEVATYLGQTILSPAEAGRAVDTLLEMNIPLVALSMGADGMLLANHQTRTWARPPKIVALNPVGAGDALVAGLIWAITQGLTLPEVARWGVAAGTAAAMHRGVSVGSREEIEAICKQVSLKTWSDRK